MRMYDLIHKKRHGGELTGEEIRFFVTGYTKGDIPDYQASALTMAICFQGMTERETALLTDEMAKSGDTVDLSRFGTLSVDKHSTGGVGDKTSLILGPMVAALGGKVTKMSGRGLGHTGGTVDKLESIPGYRTTLSAEEFLEQVERVGLAIIGQSGNLAPADKKLYALRDVTATVESLPLITSSIMSKKLAAGSHNIVLDVKVGSGAFMKTREDAEKLAGEMVKIGRACGRQVSALITNMDTPLGCAVGNALEVKEAIGVLKNEISGDLRDICIALAAEMAALVKNIPVEEAKVLAEQTLLDGTAFEKMKAWVEAQGGDTRVLDTPALFLAAKYQQEVISDRDGYITGMNAEEIGLISVLLGAGRASKEDVIHPAAGLMLHKKTGDRVKAGEALCTLYTDRKAVIPDATARYLSAITLENCKPEPIPLILSAVR